MIASPSSLPRWDLVSVYPSLDSPEFSQAFAALSSSLDAVAVVLDALPGDPTGPAKAGPEGVATFETLIGRINQIGEQVRTIGAYVYGCVSTNSRDELAQASLSRFQNLLVRVRQAQTRFVAWISTLDLDPLLAGSTMAIEHAYFLRQAREQARHLMSPAEEDLAAALEPSSGSAWDNLHGNLTSQLLVAIPGEQPIPLSLARARATDPDREARRLAHEAEIAALREHALGGAAALNGIKGQVLVLADRRGWDSPLDEALFTCHMDRQTLDAMLGAAHNALPDFRRYLQAKARALGVPALAWYDLSAPVGRSTRDWSFDEAASFIVEQFASYSPRLSELAARAFRDRWIDAEPRAGKRDGAFCMELRAGESRILANFTPSFDSVSTLAHELGHAYHNLCLAERTPLQQDTPMTLAETASIFCETIIFHAGLRQAEEAEQLALLEGTLQSQCQVVVDILSRYLFEQRLFEQRRERELSIEELNQLMLATQRETYGDALDQSTLHPYMWLVKGHYYSSELSYYNFPYMFGLLFGLGLYARYQADPEPFKEHYDRLLSSTGMADAAVLAADFGIDIRDKGFWAGSFSVIRGDIDRFETVVNARKPAR
ncbi:MAG TPA: M3 family oligoendopeptidase [Chloroflexota bacterium]